MIEKAIVKIVDKQDLTYDEAYEVISEIMAGPARRRMPHSLQPCQQSPPRQKPLRR